jgi:poly(ADP-ribose) glycohydrolase ARH3
VRVEESTITDRFRGVLLGTAVGDCLGAPMEGRELITEAFLDRLRDDPGPLRYTDDTAMTIGVARSLIACRGFDGHHMAHTLADIYAAEPWRGYGMGAPVVFGHLERGVPWDRAATSLFGGAGSFGNGGAMRVAPVALFAGDIRETAAVAERTALITHTHPEGVDGAVTQAVAIAFLLRSEPNRSVDLHDLIDVVRQHAITDVFGHRLGLLHRLVDDPASFDIVGTLGNGVAARTSVPTALCAFLLHPADFAGAIRTALSFGGDTDTIGAMAGALAGARHGVGAIPERWRQAEGGTEVLELADQLLELAAERGRGA